MRTFNEYYLDQFCEGRIGDFIDRVVTGLADKALTRHRKYYGQIGADRRPEYPKFQRGTVPAPQGQNDSGSSVSPAGSDLEKDFPFKYNPAIDKEQPPQQQSVPDSFRYNPHLGMFPGHDEELLNQMKGNQDLRKLVYQKIEDMVNTGQVSSSKDLFQALMGDAELQNYLASINPSQKGAFTRRFNKAMSNRQPVTMPTYQANTAQV